MTDMADQPAAPQRKVDPETLVLRARPARATRFRRGAVVGLAGIAATFVAGATWLAFKPASFGSMIAREDDASPAAKPPADMLAGAPKGYDDVPRLGPKLPGDLGRPILEKQRELDAALPTDPAAEAALRAAEEAETERLRLAEEERAARRSGVMLPMANGPAKADAVRAPTGDEKPGAPVQAAGAGPADGAASRAAGRIETAEDVSPHRLAEPVSPWTIHAGSIIAASLITGLNSDTPGIVTAQVTENAYDSVTGRTLLLPQGSRLVGSYDSVVASGQSRALVVWQRIILPDGSSIRIDNAPASDTQGYAGLTDRIDRHTWQLLKGVALSTLLGVGTELGWGSGESDLVRAVREAAQQNGARAGDQIVGKSLDIQPTLRVRPGWPLRVVVHKDIVLRPWRP